NATAVAPPMNFQQSVHRSPSAHATSQCLPPSRRASVTNFPTTPRQSILAKSVLQLRSTPLHLQHHRLHRPQWSPIPYFPTHLAPQISAALQLHPNQSLPGPIRVHESHHPASTRPTPPKQ